MRAAALPGPPAGLELDDTPASLEALDQLLPRWRDDAEILPWLGNDAGLYLGTVIVRTVPGAAWDSGPAASPSYGSRPAVSSRWWTSGLDWAVQRGPELSQVYAEVAEA